MFAALLLSFGAVCAPQDAGTQPPAHFRMQLHEARDIVDRIGPDFPAPRLGTPRPARSGLWEGQVPLLADLPVVSTLLKPPATNGGLADELARVAAGSRVLESVAARLITPKSQDPLFSLRCTENGTLVINGTQAQVEWLGAFLGHLRTYDKRIEVEARFVRTPAGRLEELGIQGTSAFPRPEDLPALLEALQQTPKVEFVSAPRVTVLPLQRASISVLEQTKFVKDWRVETVEPGAQEVLVAEIAELDTGLALDVRAVPLPDGKIALSIEAQEAQLARPLVPFTKKLKTRKGETEVALALPEVDVRRVQSELLLQDGSTALLVLEDPSGSKDLQLVVVVTARSVSAK